MPRDNDAPYIVGVDEYKPRRINIKAFFVSCWVKEDKPPQYTLDDVIKARSRDRRPDDRSVEDDEEAQLELAAVSNEKVGRRNTRETFELNMAQSLALDDDGDELGTGAGKEVKKRPIEERKVAAKTGAKAEMLPEPQVGLRLFLATEHEADDIKGVLVEVKVEKHLKKRNYWALRATAEGQRTARGLRGRGMELLGDGELRWVTSDALKWYIEAKPALHRRHNKDLMESRATGVAI